jgi:hypothetical protein
MKFKSDAEYGKDAKTGDVFDLKDNSLGICIHKYAGCGDALFLNSKALNIDNYDLRTEDFNEAVGKAKEIIMCKVKKIREDSYRFYTDNNIEIDRH